MEAFAIPRALDARDTVNDFHATAQIDLAEKQGQESGMAKILPFRRTKQEANKQIESVIDKAYMDHDISAIMNDYSLTPANRHWILENMLMNIDDQLEEHRRELEKAERKLDALVRSAEKEIIQAYSEFESRVLGITQEVKKLTRASSRGKNKDDKLPSGSSEQL